MSIDSKALNRAAKKMAEAVKQTRLAYQFCPSAYTHAAFQACLAAAEALDQHIAALAVVQSAEWLRKFPAIAENDDAD